MSSLARYRLDRALGRVRRPAAKPAAQRADRVRYPDRRGSGHDRGRARRGRAESDRRAHRRARQQCLSGPARRDREERRPRRPVAADAHRGRRQGARARGSERRRRCAAAHDSLPRCRFKTPTPRRRSWEPTRGFFTVRAWKTRSGEFWNASSENIGGEGVRDRHVARRTCCSATPIRSDAPCASDAIPSWSWACSKPKGQGPTGQDMDDVVVMPISHRALQADPVAARASAHACC